MDIDYLQEPTWYHSAIALNVVFPFLVVVSCKWIRDLRIIVAVPLVGSTVAAAYGAVVLLTTVERFEAGWPTRAAGISSALIPVSIGAAVSAVLSGIVASAAPNSFAMRRTNLGSVLVGLQALGCMAWAALTWSLLRSTLPSLNLMKAIAWVTFVFSATILVVSVAAALLARPIANAKAAPKRGFAVFAAASLAGAIIVFWGSLRLERDLNQRTDRGSQVIRLGVPT